MTECIDIHLRFSDPELGQLVADSPPPEGVTVSKSQHLVEASGATGGIFLSIVVSFTVGVPSSLVAAWLYDCFKKSGKPGGTINKEEIVFKERRVETFVKNEVTKYYRYRTEKRDHDDKKG